MEQESECSNPPHNLRKIKTKYQVKQAQPIATIKAWEIRGLTALLDRSRLVIINLRSHLWLCRVQLAQTLTPLRTQA